MTGYGSPVSRRLYVSINQGGERFFKIPIWKLIVLTLKGSDPFNHFFIVNGWVGVLDPRFCGDDSVYWDDGFGIKKI